ncbi:hypothetical protein [Oleidesulfovibrio sp.]|uniref:hypothetical protein n=1 Tax=Oleidesulfovibrio sp. TaxID=2909707 RepID=UPI003A864CE9
MPHCILFISLITLLAFPLPSFANRPPVPASPLSGFPPITMSHVQPKEDAVGCWLNALYTEAFKRLGYRMSYVYLPTARASYSADTGNTDGELDRMSHYGDAHPNLIKVEEPHLNVRVIAYTNRPMAALTPETIVQNNLSVAYRKGFKQADDLFNGQKNLRKFHITASASGIKMLQAKHVDVFIEVEPILLKYFQTSPEALHEIFNSGVLASENAHAYINRKHEKLVAPLAQTLRQMKHEHLLTHYARMCRMPLPQPESEQQGQN